MQKQQRQLTQSERYSKATNGAVTPEQASEYIRLRKNGVPAHYALVQATSEVYIFQWKKPKSGKSEMYATITQGPFKVVLRLLQDEHYNPAEKRGKFTNKVRKIERRKSALVVPESYKNPAINRYFLPREPIEDHCAYLSRLGQPRHVAYITAQRKAHEAMHGASGHLGINGYIVHCAIRDATDAILAESTSDHIECNGRIEEHYMQINEEAAYVVESCIMRAKLRIQEIRLIDENSLDNLLNMQEEHKTSK